MSDLTVKLSLPYLLPSQSQKHVTHNEALQVLDAVVHLVIEDTISVPPADAAEGDCYCVADGATGVWAGKDGAIATLQDGAWIFLRPAAGWSAWFRQQSRSLWHDGVLWRDQPLPPNGSVQSLGINATADSVNRLALTAPASLFNHDGNGHQIKVNKAHAVDTGSLLFQTGWSGRAEMGLAGSDDFSIKISGDGSAWKTALSIGSNGVVVMPQRPVVRASLNDTTLTPATASMTGFQTLSAVQGGFTLGAVVPSGTGNRLVVPATGLYTVHLTVRTISSSGHSVTLLANGATSLAIIDSTAGSAGTTQTVSVVTNLSQGDWLALRHEGTAQLAFGRGKTELSAIMV